MKTLQQITKDELENALNPTPWDLGNNVLYELCKSHPYHEDEATIIAKIWLIGRSYAASIERHKNKKNASDDFYESVVAPKIKCSKIDEIISEFSCEEIDIDNMISTAVYAHKKVMDIFHQISKQNHRSLVSKYLHFHCPNVFFIYDSRAQVAITKLTPDCRSSEIVKISLSNVDEDYYKFYLRVNWLRQNINEKFSKNLTPRQIDNILLNTKKS